MPAHRVLNGSPNPPQHRGARTFLPGLLPRLELVETRSRAFRLPHSLLVGGEVVGDFLVNRFSKFVEIATRVPLVKCFLCTKRNEHAEDNDSQLVDEIRPAVWRLDYVQASHR